MSALSHKIKRYRNLISQFKNWFSFLLFKSSKKKESFLFRMRNDFEIEVPRQMLPPFKESFFDQVYLDGFPHQLTLGRAPVVIDVGANVGYFGLYMFCQCPDARVYAYEPMPYNFRQLKAYKDYYSGLVWHIENKAISDHQNGITLNTSTVAGFSTMASVFESDGKGEKIEVGTLTLNDVIKGHGLEVIDLLKLDCEGSEYTILYTASDEIFQQIRYMCIETHQGSDPGQDHQSLVDFLKTKGFALKDTHQKGEGYIWAWR